MSEKRLCEIYKSLREDEMYLYVDRTDGLSRVPAPLLARMGNTALVTTLALTPGRKLARADAGKVLAAIAEQGYYLQMPPGKDQLIDAPMQALGARNEKLPR